MAKLADLLRRLHRMEIAQQDVSGCIGGGGGRGRGVSLGLLGRLRGGGVGLGLLSGGGGGRGCVFYGNLFYV